MSSFPLSREQISELEENLEVCTAIGTTRDGVTDLCDMARGYLDEHDEHEQTPALVATSRAYSAVVAERDSVRAALAQCREVMRKINDNEQQCPICHGKRQMEPTMEWGWIPGEIQHRNGCLFLSAMNGSCQ